MRNFCACNECELIQFCRQTGLKASVAMLLAMLAYDAHVARLFGKDPETIFELILMLRDARFALIVSALSLYYCTLFTR